MFDFEQTTGTTKIFFNDSEILSFVQEHLCFRSFRIDNLRLKPSGPVEFIGMPASCFYFSNLLKAEVGCNVKSKDEIEITLKPSKVDKNLDQKIYEERVINIIFDEAKQRFVYTFNIHLEFKEDIYGNESGINIEKQPQWGNDDYAAIEFDDPLLNGGKGPQVPMTQNWTGILEPWFHEQCFTQNWEKRYRSVIINTVFRGLRKIEFNRSVNSEQQFYNRHILKALPKTPFIYEKTDDSFIEFTPGFDVPTGHHICEWGYDMHWYALVPKADKDKDLYFSRGSKMDFSYQIKEINRTEVPAEYLTAKTAELEPAEQLLANMPIYEEPVCLFVKSGIDSPDASRWTPGNDKCFWNNCKEMGALLINNGDKAEESKWIFDRLGPSNGCNPIPPKSKFKISAWIKADEIEQVKLIHILNSYNGPGMFALGKTETVSIGNAENIKKQNENNVLIEFISEESGPYCLDGKFEFIYSGKGLAQMSLLSIERL